MNIPVLILTALIRIVWVDSKRSRREARGGKAKEILTRAEDMHDGFLSFEVVPTQNGRKTFYSLIWKVDGARLRLYK